MAEFETFTLRTLGCFKMIAHLRSPFWIREGASRTNIFRNQNHRFRSKFTYCKLFEAYAGVIFLGKIDSALIQEVQKHMNRMIACDNPVAVSTVGTLACALYYTRTVRPRRESFAEHEQEQEQEQL